MRLAQAVRQSNTDCAVPDVNRWSIHYSVIAKHDGLQGTIVCKHAHYDVTLCSLGGNASKFCTRRNQHVCLGWRPVPHCQIMTCPQQVGGHGTTHLPKPNKSDLHQRLSLSGLVGFRC